MHAGYLMLCQNAHVGLSDSDMVRSEMRLAELTEECGFSTCWAAEHHFDWYSMIPDNLQVLAYLSARTSRIQLGTGAVILPWNDPVRVVEKLCMLDALSGGRAVFGIGRGLARREYAAFGIDMAESRERFNEAARMVVRALETGFIEGEGPFYPQKRTEIRPRPGASFKNRFYGVAMSADTAPVVAALGARMKFFIQFQIEQHLPTIELYRTTFQQQHARVAPPPLAIDVTYCHRDAARAEDVARKYVAGYYLSLLEHYEFLSDYHRDTKGYESYAAVADILKAEGKERALEDYVNVQAFGTPQQILDKLEKRRQAVGPFEWDVMLSYAGMPYDMVEASMRLLGDEVLPEIRQWDAEDSIEPGAQSRLAVV